jgi:serine/threonine protein kinase
LLKAGTPLYRPPEQDNGQPGDERADVYMVGASLRELLCSHEREMEEYPLALQNIVNRMWAVNREERYRNADEAIAALNVFRAQHLSGEQT